MLSSQSLCSLEEAIKRCRQLPGRLDAASLEILERATTRLEVRSVETESCRRLAGRTGGAYSPRRLASNGLRFTQQGSMLARLDDAATVDPEGTAVQTQLEIQLAEAAEERPVTRRGRRSRRLSTPCPRDASEEWVDVGAELREVFSCTVDMAVKIAADARVVCGGTLEKSNRVLSHERIWPCARDSKSQSAFANRYLRDRFTTCTLPACS